MSQNKLGHPVRLIVTLFLFLSLSFFLSPGITFARTPGTAYRIEPSPSASSGQVTIQGTINWEDQNGNPHPASQVKVEVWDDDSFSRSLITTVKTDDKGKYKAVITNDTSFPENGYDIFLVVYTESKSARVRYEWDSSVTCFASSSVTHNIGGTKVTKNFNIYGRDGKPFSVHQAIVEADRYVAKINGRSLGKVEVVYPYLGDTSCYDSDKNIINIKDQQTYVWDAILHEYGHFVADQLGFRAPYGGEHEVGDSLSDQYGKAKGIGLAWNEGWADYFSLCVQRNPKFQSYDMPGIGDTEFQTELEGSGWPDIENYVGRGEDNEMGVACTLWDLYDDADDNGEESVSLGDEFIFKALKSKQPKSFSSAYWAIIFGKPYDEIADIGCALVYNCIAPLPSIEGYDYAGLGGSCMLRSDEAPEIIWRTNGMSDKYKNNSFIVQFYDKNYNKIFESETIPTNGEKSQESYKPTQEQWDNILRESNGTINVIIRAKQTADPVTGPYYSSKITLQKEDYTWGIEVTSPNGGENWQIGSKYNVTWKYYSRPAEYVNIDIVTGTSTINVASNISIGNDGEVPGSGSGSYPWMIPQNIPTGSYKLVVSTVDKSTKDTSDNDFTIGNPSGFTVSGKVTTPNDVPLSTAIISFQKIDGPGRLPVTSTAVDADGTWSISGFGSGTTYQAKVSCPGYTFEKSTETFAGAKVINFVATGYKVSGHVLSYPGLGAVAGAKITFTPGGGPAAVYTDSTGYWEQTGFAAGQEYTATVSKEGYVFKAPSARSFTGPQAALDFYAESYSAAGSVHTRGGDGISGATITFSPVDYPSGLPGTVTTDANGNWAQEGFVANKTYMAVPSKDGFGGYKFQPASINFNQYAHDINFIISAQVGCIFTGRVTTNDGTGLAGVTINFSSSDSSAPPSVVTDADGCWSQAGFLADVSYTVIASKQNWTFTPAEIGDLIPRADSSGEVDDISGINFRGNPSTVGYLNGLVKDAVTQNAIPDVLVAVYDGEYLLTHSSTSSTGQFSIALQPGSGLVVVLAKEGYITETYGNIEVTANNTTYLETILQVSSLYQGPGNIEGYVYNAMTGNGVSGLSLSFRKGINMTAGPVSASTITGANGYYTIQNLEAGSYTGEITGTGYNTNYFTAVCLGGQTNSNQNATVTPTMPEGQIRIVLTWGISPTDLDSHLFLPTPDGSRYHICYYSKTYSYNGSIYADLDLDDVTSYGPETTTIRQQVDGTYRFSVHDFTNRGSYSSYVLSNSGAQVKVYSGSTLMATYNVPANQGGTLWKVFEINGGTIIPINTLSYSYPYDAAAPDSLASYSQVKTE